MMEKDSMRKGGEEIEYIEHRGTVKSVDTRRGVVRVALEDSEGCGSCPASKLCGGAATSGREVEAASGDAGSLRTGDKVTVRGTERMHRKAIMLATVIPSVALVAIMTAIFVLTANQLAAALGGLGSMVFFFVLLYACRNRIAHEFRFEVRKNQSSGIS